ncbi:MAG TPA: TPM domain-containing protein [Blastocatellia bacterium]|nr:TPM domain-containing protein [Blastocatellia bacterium]
MTRALIKAGAGLAIIFFISLSAFAQIQVPQPQGWVNDFANKLSPQTRQSLENLLTNFTNRTGVESTIVIVPEESLGGYTKEEYALVLGRTWKVGRASDKRAMVLLVVIKPSDEQGCHGDTRLEVSRHLEGDLPDGLAWEVIRRMRNDFQACRFDQAFTTGTQTLLATVADRIGVSIEGIDSTQAYRPQPRRAPSRGRGISPSLIIFAIFIIFVIISAIGGRGGGPGGRRYGRRGLGGAEWMLLPIIFGSGRGGWGGSRGDSGWGGGGGWGGGDGGGGFGGFGGGGDFGGGGASDSW